MDLPGHARLSKSAAIFLTLVTERIDFGRDYHRGWQATQVRGLQRRHMGIPRLIWMVQITRPEELHHLACQQIALSVLLVGTCTARVVGQHRIDEELCSQAGSTLIPYAQGCYRGQVGPRAVASNGDFGRTGVEF